MTPPVTVVPKAYDLVLWLVPRVNEFPRAQRFVLGERIESTALDLLDTLVDAQFRRDKGVAWRLVEQRYEQPPLRSAQQQRPGEPQQQHRVSLHEDVQDAGARSAVVDRGEHETSTVRSWSCGTE